MALAQAVRTHCPQGHAYDDENTTYSGGRRHCRACARARYRAKHPQSTVTRWERLQELFTAGRRAECWLWQGSQHKYGYGVYNRELAHRLVYGYMRGPIPEGLCLDHLCRVRLCVNPWHLEPVTIGENVMRGVGLAAENARKTRCPQGHPYDEDNTYVHPVTGWRACRACVRARARRRAGSRARGGDAQ